jgi:hypothetical protein
MYDVFLCTRARKEGKNVKPTVVRVFCSQSNFCQYLVLYSFFLGHTNVSQHTFLGLFWPTSSNVAHGMRMTVSSMFFVLIIMGVGVVWHTSAEFCWRGSFAGTGLLLAGAFCLLLAHLKIKMRQQTLALICH